MCEDYDTLFLPDIFAAVKKIIDILKRAFIPVDLPALTAATLVSARNLKTDIQSLNNSNGKLLTDMIDTSTRMGKNMLSLYNKFGQIGFSGYLQPQFQYAESKGNPNTFQGGDWGPFVNNRFRLRRGRLRTDFTHFTPDGKPVVYFLFQFDGTERGVNIRDFWGRYYENKWQLFHFFLPV